MNKVFTAYATLLGTIVGAGFLAIPYVSSKSGFPIAVAYLLMFALIIGLTMLYLSEVIIKTRTKHQLPGYAEVYLGKKGKYLMLTSLMVGIYAALIAYLIGESESISIFLFGSNIYSLYIGLVFWVILSALSFFGLRILKKISKMGVLAVFLVIALVVVFYSGQINLDNLSYVHFENIFAPFGVILFAYLAFSIVPELNRILSDQNKNMKKVILAAYVSVFIVYLIMTFIVLGYKGEATPEIATFAFSRGFIILGIITMFTAYLSFSNALIDIYQYDMKMKRAKSWMLCNILPLIAFIYLYFTKNNSFSMVLNIGGILSGGLTALLILLMVYEVKKMKIKSDYNIPYSAFVSILIFLILLSGVIIEVISVLK